MKKSAHQNKLDLLDWALSIDFDPVEITRVRRDAPAPYVSILDGKAIRPKKGDC